MAITHQMHETIAYNVSERLPQTEPEHKKNRLSQILLAGSTLKRLFNVFRRQRYQECARVCGKNSTVSEARPQMGICVRLRERLKSRTIQETIENTK